MIFYLVDMKIMIFLYSLLISSFCFGQITDNQTDRTITVTAEASQTVEPNIGYLDFQVSTIHDDINQAKAANDEKVKNVISFLNKQKFERSDIKTITVYLTDYTDFNAKAENRKKQYQSTNFMRITFRDLKMYDLVSTELIKKGVSSLSRLQLTHTELAKFKNELTGQALTNAKEKAVKMAKTLDSEIGKVVQIYDEQSINNPPKYDSGMLSEVVQLPPTLASGNLNISTKVRVVFALN